MSSKLLMALTCAGLAHGLLRAGEPLSLPDQLHRLVAVDPLGQAPRGERLRTLRAADATPGPVGWSRQATLEGPGVIVRIFCARAAGRIRLLLDGEPPLELELRELFAGGRAPFRPGFGDCAAAGCLSTFPIAFAQRAEVAFESLEADWQLEWLSGAPVAPLSASLPEDAVAAADGVARLLADGLGEAELFGGRRCPPAGADFTLKRGEKYTWALEGAGVIRALYLALSDRQAPRELYALHRCLLRIYFDGREQPAVEAPVSSFFGAGYEPLPFNGLLLGTDRDPPIPLPGKRFGDDRVMYCFIPMPFSDGARIEVENLNPAGRPISFFLYLRVEEIEPPSGAEPSGEVEPPGALRFHARYRRLETRSSREVQFATLPGPGRFLGLTLLLDVPRPAAWWETRLLLRPDGLRGSAAGTLGAELGAAGGARARFTPLSALTRVAEQGKISGHRLRTHDALEFSDALVIGLADPPHEAFCGAVLYWYGPADGRLGLRRLRPEDLEVPGLRIPDALEIETALRGADWGQILLERNAGGVELSGGRAAQITTDQPVTLVISSPAARHVRLRLRVHPRRVFERIEFMDAAGALIGAADYQRGAEGWYELGVVKLAPGENTLTVRCTRPAVLDCLVLTDE